MCKDKTCTICHTYIVVSTVAGGAFGTFPTEEEAIKWAKHYNWPVGTWTVINLHPISIG